MSYGRHVIGNIMAIGTTTKTTKTRSGSSYTGYVTTIRDVMVIVTIRRKTVRPMRLKASHRVVLILSSEINRIAMIYLRTTS